VLTLIAGEITVRELYNGYFIFQGGIPEVEEFSCKLHKWVKKEQGCVHAGERLL